MLKLLLILCIASSSLNAWVDFDKSTGTYTIDKFGTPFKPIEKNKYRPFQHPKPTPKK